MHSALYRFYCLLLYYGSVFYNTWHSWANLHTIRPNKSYWFCDSCYVPEAYGDFLWWWRHDVETFSPLLPFVGGINLSWVDCPCWGPVMIWFMLTWTSCRINWKNLLCQILSLACLFKNFVWIDPPKWTKQSVLYNLFIQICHISVMKGYCGTHRSMVNALPLTVLI